MIPASFDHKCKLKYLSAYIIAENDQDEKKFWKLSYLL